MSELVNRLRSSRDNISVLRLQLLKIRGRHQGLIFVFEGPDDVAVYEEWLRHVSNCRDYEPLPASGKKQVLGLLSSLSGSRPDLIKGVYFFVDRDFDLPVSPHSHLYELECYSIENLLCTDAVLESILKDEFRCAGDIDLRNSIKAKMASFLHELDEKCSEINLRIFEARRKGRKIVRKPEKIGQIVRIEITGISSAYNSIDEIFQAEPVSTGVEIDLARSDFIALPDELRQRGKYKIEAFKKWLKLLADDAGCDSPQIFPSRVKVNDVNFSSLRRFASCAQPPQSLINFLGTVH